MKSAGTTRFSEGNKKKKKFDPRVTAPLMMMLSHGSWKIGASALPVVALARRRGTSNVFFGKAVGEPARSWKARSSSLFLRERWGVGGVP